MTPPQLLLGPLLRHVGERTATIWVETDRACEVAILGARARTFAVSGHHYALVVIEGLEPGATHPYTVELDGHAVWPEPGTGPQSTIRTLGRAGPLRIAFGSCRVAAPHAAPWSLTKDEDAEGREIDALLALAVRMRASDPSEWPELLVLLGDQVYADQVSPATKRFIESRAADRNGAPLSDVADFEEYCHLYWEAWRTPLMRWLLSTVPTTMIFDDHDVHDDWNTSDVWVREIREQPWWRERILGAYASYWVYQHIGNLSPEDLREDEIYPQVAAADDATELLRGFAARAEVEPSASRWSFRRDLGSTRLVVVDSRAGRVLDPRQRDMLDEREWEWLDAQLTGDVDHLLVGTSLPFLLAPGMHHLEAWDEAVAGGAWGGLAARVAESLRQALDLEHWAAFDRSFRRLTAVLTEVASGRRGRPPVSIVLLSGDVHHAYVAEARLPGPDVQSVVAQVTCSPFRNPLSTREQRAMRFAQSGPVRAVTRRLARRAGVPPPRIAWEISDGPWFDNQIGELEIEGRRIDVTLSKSPPGDAAQPRLDAQLDRTLAD
jgi:phosphodiesterase/alkaline phosphatase D-like protein